MAIKDELKELDAADFCRNNGIVLRAIIIGKSVGKFSFMQLCNMLEAYNLSISDVLECIDYFEDKGYIETTDTDGHICKACDQDEKDICHRLTADGRLVAKGITIDKAVEL